MKNIFALLGILYCCNIHAQTVELYAGDKRAGVDIMWFKPVKNKKGEQTHWLLFSRNRASVDYHNQPAWGSVNAVSYNLKNGVGIVCTGVFGATGFVPKAGIQLVKRKKDFLFFGWMVIEMLHQPNVDLFGLFRYQPVLSKSTKLFVQAETSNAFPTVAQKTFGLTQRLRLGLSVHQWQFGLMADVTNTGRKTWNATQNTGVFFRSEL